MRIRKEISPFNTRLFMQAVAILLVLLNGLILVLNLLSGRSFLEYTASNWTLGLLQPVLLASVFAYHARKVTIFINDYQSIESFTEKLNKVLLDNGVKPERTTNNTTSYIPTGWLYRLFNYWSRTEVVQVYWGDEMIVEGSARLVTQVEDSLTWNAMFRTHPVKV